MRKKSFFDVMRHRARMKNNALFFKANPSKSGCVIKTPAYLDPPNFYNPSIYDEPGRMNPPPNGESIFHPNP